MQILENGDYLLDDGRVIKAEDVAKQYKTAPRSAKSLEAEESDTDNQLQEGQSSGPMRLED